MPPVSAPSWRPVGQLLGDAWRLSLSCAGDLAALSALAAFPPVALAGAALILTGLTDPAAYEEAVTVMDFGRLWPFFLAGLAGKVWTVFCSIAVFVLLESSRHGQSASAREALERSKPLFWPFVVTGLRATVYIAAGLLLLVVPGIMLAWRYLLAHIAVIVEGLGGSVALARSRELMAAKPAGALGRLLAAATVAAVAVFLLIGALDLLSAFSQTMVEAAPGLLERQLFAAVVETAAGLCTAWFSAASLLLYHDLASLAPPPSQQAHRS